MRILAALRALARRIRSRGIRLATVAAGIAIVALSFWSFSRIADLVTDNGRIVLLDGALVRFMARHHSAWGDTLFSGIAELGASVLLVIMIAAVALLVSHGYHQRAKVLVLVCGSGLLLNDGLKLLFRRGRPELPGSLDHHRTWSFPSGHAMNSVICYGFLCTILLEHVDNKSHRRWLVGGSMLLVALIGFSRVYLAAHYMSDVLAGYLAGLVWLVTGLAIDAWLSENGNAAPK